MMKRAAVFYPGLCDVGSNLGPNEQFWAQYKRQLLDSSWQLRDSMDILG